jgi:hypothetical protein
VICCLLALLLLAFPSPAQAADPGRPPFASWITRHFSGLATRSRVVQVCVVSMCLALFILMKKFDGAEPRR